LTAKTLLIGSGARARSIAEQLIAHKYDIIVATLDDDFDVSSPLPAVDTTQSQTEIYTGTKILSCRGAVGNYEVTLDLDGHTKKTEVAQIIIAEKTRRTPCFSLYGLMPAKTIMTLSDLKSLVSKSSGNHKPFADPMSVVFLAGVIEDTTPVLMQEIMRACLMLQTEYAHKTYILTRNLKVAARGMEQLYRDTKAAGVVYIKFTDTPPDIVPMADGRVRFEFVDEITGDPLRLTADMTIVDEKLAPSDYAVELANIFELEKDSRTFFQSDNVHRLTVYSNRNGILVAGPARSVQSTSDPYIDAGDALLSLLEPEGAARDQALDKALIEPGKCVRCLTCYRLCPYRAILVNARVTVVADACERCGICVAECPRGAINIGDDASATLYKAQLDSVVHSGKTSNAPSILAYCCSRSAARAAELAACMGHALPRGLKIVEVPCGGDISVGRILAALRSSADGVVVLTCHEGNCHSEFGNRHAWQRVEQIKAHLASIGLENERLIQKTLASNMGTEFAQALVAFENTLAEIGANRLKTSI
jgi:coenzyme F420-reducing hydrogenase delta subunit/Pyruvate/2-oxoacid:ferredoxin oxidoreductase delta subunit